jgi:RNA polymerase sigma-70 factor (ECF subfamily)
MTVDAPDPRRDTRHDPLRALLAAGSKGDTAAMTELVEATQPLVWRLCQNLGSVGEVEDLVQETYLRAFRSAAGFRGDALVTSWLLTIARNVCADHVRRRARQARLLTRVSREATAAVTHNADPLVDDLVGRLAPERRQAFVLTQLVGLPYAEAAEILDCPIGTIRSRVARARSDLLTTVHRAEAS